MSFGSIRVVLQRTGAFAVALAASGMLAAALASPARAADMPVGDQRALLQHLSEWHRCRGMQLLDADWVCHPEPALPARLEALVDALHDLSRLDALAIQRRTTGQPMGQLARCAIAISSEVFAVAAERVSGRKRTRGRDAVEQLCDGLELPAWPAGRPDLDPNRACSYAIDAGRVLRGAALLKCVRTLADARLAEAGVGPALKRPNIVVILTDDQRWDTIDATHSPFPALGLPAMPATYSRLAGEGVTFTQAVVTTPICGPSRGSFFTGLHTWRHRMLSNGGQFGPARFADDDTFATRLAAAGYRTGFIGKYANGFTDLWQPGIDPPYTPPGWDEFIVFDHDQSVPQTGFSMLENGVVVSYDTPEQPYSTDVITEKALAFIEQSLSGDRDEPFALWISTTAPHYPWDPAERHFGAFDQLQVLLYPNSWEADVSDKPPWLAARPDSVPTGLPLLGHRNLRARQLEMQLSIDEMVAALVDDLDARGIGDDTVIVYASDNGHAWGEHRWDTKACAWEECVRIPLLVRYPRLVPGPRTEGGLVANVDVVPTLLALAGAEVADDLDGVDLGDTLRGQGDVPERDVLLEVYTGGTMTYAGVRGDHVKYVLYQSGFEELYDLETDPWELENAASRPESAALLEAMRGRLSALWPGFEGARAD